MRSIVSMCLAACACALLLAGPVAAQVMPADDEEAGAKPTAPLPTKVTTAKTTRTLPKTVATELPIPPPARTETAAFHGEGWFQQHCAVCHTGRWRKSGQLNSYAPSLSGVLANATPEREAQVREYIRKGSNTMPGFEHTFNPAQFEELVSYLKSLGPQNR